MSQEDPQVVADVEAGEAKKESECTSDEKKSEESSIQLDNKDSESKDDDIENKVTLTIEMFFFLIGTNILYAYNTFINGNDFFVKLFPERDIGMELSRVLTISSGVCYLITLPFIEQFTLVSRMYASTILMAALQIIIWIYVNVGTPKYQVVYTLAALTSAVQSVLYGTSMGYAGLFGMKTSAMANTGVALGGLISSILRMISKTLPRGDGWFYFAFTVICSLSSAICFHIFNKTEISQERVKLAQTSSNFIVRMKRIGGVFKKIWPFVLEGFLNMTITLTFFPGYALYIGDHHHLGSWYRTIILFMYMVGDFVGRLFTRWFSWPSAKYLWIPHVCRLVFIILYVCPVEGVFLQDDIFIDFVTLALALTEGYWGGLCITYTATCEKLEEEEIDLGVFTTVLATNLGVFAGSWLTFAAQAGHK